MATRNINLGAGEWVDLVTTANPDLVGGKLYSANFVGDTTVQIFETADNNEPASLVTGHVMESGPRGFAFRAPETGKVWAKAMDKAVTLVVSNAESET